MNDASPKFTLEKEKVPYVAIKYSADVEKPLTSGETLDLGQRAPLLDSEAVATQVGVPLGDLMAVMQLPYRRATGLGPGGVHSIDDGNWRERWLDSVYHSGQENDSRAGATKVYCFRMETQGRHAKRGYEYYLMGASQIEQLKAGVYGADEASEARGDVLHLTQGEEASIGREGWLPNIGWDYQLLKGDDPWVGTAFQSVSRQQVSAAVTEAGSLLLTGNPDSYSGNVGEMIISIGEPVGPHPFAQGVGRVGLRATA